MINDQCSVAFETGKHDGIGPCVAGPTAGCGNGLGVAQFFVSSPEIIFLYGGGVEVAQTSDTRTDQQTVGMGLHAIVSNYVAPWQGATKKQGRLSAPRATFDLVRAECGNDPEKNCRLDPENKKVIPTRISQVQNKMLKSAMESNFRGQPNVFQRKRRLLSICFTLGSLVLAL